MNMESKKLTNEEGVTIIKDGACHRLIIDCCKKSDTAVYRFEAEGRKSEAILNIQGRNQYWQICWVSLIQFIKEFTFLTVTFLFSLTRPTKN